MAFSLMLAVAALAIGLLLGLIGGGGSILTVPVLVYWAGFSASDAVVVSLVTVGFTSLIAMALRAEKKHVCWKTGMVFGCTGMVGAYIGGRLTTILSDTILLAGLALVMLAAAAAMLRNQRVNQATRQPGEPFCPTELPIAAILFDGLLVGLVTGLVGVGGGFLLVPALNFLAGLPLHAAIGTSLLIIVLQSVAALLGHTDHISADWHFAAAFAGCATLGSLLGSRLSDRLDERHLKSGFGALVLAIGIWLVSEQIRNGLFEQLTSLYDNHRGFIAGLLAGILGTSVYSLWERIHNSLR